MMFTSTYSTEDTPLDVITALQEHEGTRTLPPSFVELSIPLAQRFTKPLGLLCPEQG